MLKAKFIDTDAAPCAWFAAKDASMRNAIGITHFSAAERRKGTSIMDALGTMYRAQEAKPNWRWGGKSGRPKFMSIKFCDPAVTQRKALGQYEDGFAKDLAIAKVEKRESGQGIIYRVFFK